LAEGKPPVEVELTWDGDLRFRGRAGQTPVVVDSDGAAGTSPVQSLALALAGCMSVDVVHILERAASPYAACARTCARSGRRRIRIGWCAWTCASR
jgi:uncharacterized OsmC-like protein